MARPCTSHLDSPPKGRTGHVVRVAYAATLHQATCSRLAAPPMPVPKAEEETCTPNSQGLGHRGRRGGLSEGGHHGLENGPCHVSPRSSKSPATSEELPCRSPPWLLLSTGHEAPQRFRRTFFRRRGSSRDCGFESLQRSQV